MLRVAALLAIATLTACGPIPVERAEQQCLERARLAAGPRGTIAVGVGSDGPASRVEIEMSTEWLQGRDPAEAYAACVYQKSGQPPRRPLYDLPDWKG
ncbi:hypothetical protein LV82_00067 [Albidovulum inexpectatum]|uniref:Lipoprotein n=1 Tax=Albidovulum inexpectatum TaxID=196587 RepID=A0A2S5JLM7_9RHOB|nr:hypothetical protein [Albidovulum inexpectatum]PPB82145.1 hypothetical protein LV82_00067 [Albidovulum inexpectatum]